MVPVTVYPFRPASGLQGASLIDLPGASTHRHPLETYVRDKGLRHATGVFIVGKDGRPTEID